MAPRALILRAADRVLDHPGPSTVAFQRAVMLCFIDASLSLFRLGRRLSR